MQQSHKRSDPHFIVHYNHCIFGIELNKTWMHLEAKSTSQCLPSRMPIRLSLQVHLLFEGRHDVLKLLLLLPMLPGTHDARGVGDCYTLTQLCLYDYRNSYCIAMYSAASA